MAPVIDLTGLQRIVASYSAQHKVIIAAGPVTVATLVRAFLTKHKLVSGAVAAGGAWLAIQGLAGPTLSLIHDQFGYLQGLLGTFGN